MPCVWPAKLGLGISSENLDEPTIARFLKEIDKPLPDNKKILWPNKTISLWKVIHNYLGKEQIETICLVFIFVALVPYLFAVRSFFEKQHDSE